jgi:hypothetical protein
VAWLVIQNCGAGDNHPFVYPQTMQVGAMTAGAISRRSSMRSPVRLSPSPNTGSGDQLGAAGSATYPTEVQVRTT